MIVKNRTRSLGVLQNQSLSRGIGEPMATMYPTRPGESTPRSEQHVFDCLRDWLPGDWVVFHARRFVILGNSRRRSDEGEADFLILDPARGFICLGVKGGQEIGRDTEGWYSVPHGRADRRRIKDPGMQAQNAAHKLGHLLQEDELLRRISYGWAVAFPGAHVDVELGPSLPRDLVIDRGDLATIEAAVS